MSRTLRGPFESPLEMWNSLELLPEATMEFHGDCVRQQLCVCVRKSDRSDNAQVRNAEEQLALQDVTLLLDTAEHYCWPGLRTGETYEEPPPLEPGRDVWAEMRAANNPELRTSLGGGYYSVILVFGFAVMVHDIYAFPPRVIAMSCRRRSSSCTPFR